MENKNLESTFVEFEYGNQQVKIETNKIARQATAAVVVTIGDLVVLTTLVAKKEADPAKDFFPLAVFYASIFNGIGGMAGESLLNSMGTYLNKFWLGSLSIIIFLSFQ